MKAVEFDRMFEDGDDVIEHLDLSSARRPNLKSRRVNVEFPAWVVAGVDAEARRLGVSRQALIKLWIAERLPAGE